MNPTPETSKMQVLMPFGRWKGTPLSKLSDHYLTWLAGLDLRPWLRAAVDAERQARAQQAQFAASPPRPTPGAALLAGNIILPPPDGECPF